MKTKFQEFLSGKNISDIEKKSAEELAALYNEYNEGNRTELEKAISGKADASQIESLKGEIKEAQAEQLKNLNETLKQHGLAIKKLSAGEKKDGMINSVRAGLEANRDVLLAMKDGSKDSKISIKVAGTMTITGNVSGGNVPVEQRLSGLNPVASRTIRLMDIVQMGVAESNVISWVYQANKDGAAGGTAEGAVKNLVDFDLVVASESLKKRSAYIKVSTEMLGDISFMESEINNELMRELLKDVENQVYQGSGAGTNLNGIKTVATTFAAGTFAATVDNANNADVLTVAVNQILIANHSMPNYILMHPSDVTALKLIKASTTDRRYIDRLALIAGQLSLDGIPIIPTTLVTVDEYLIGNFVLSTVYSKGDISIEIGLDADDFTKNLRTVLAEWRGLVIVKNNDRTAFVKGVFSTNKAALETP